MKLSIAQALTYKKRVAEAIVKASADIATYNSVETFDDVSGQNIACRDFIDVTALVNRRALLKSYMVGFKMLLWENSAPVRSTILTLAELKDDAQFWTGLETKHGKVKDSYSGTVSSKDAVYKKAEVDAKVNEIKKEIDRLQSELELFNHTHFIETTDISV